MAQAKNSGGTMASGVAVVASKQAELVLAPTTTDLQSFECVGNWLSNQRSKRTRSAYSRAVGDFCGFMGLTQAGDLPRLLEARTGDVIAYRHYLQDECAAKNSTINARLAALSSLFKALQEAQLCRDNPVAGVKRKQLTYSNVDGERVAVVQTPAMTKQQVRQLLDTPDQSTLRGLRDYALLAVMAYTGCRVAEPCSLKVGDLIEDQGYHCLRFTVKGEKLNVVAIHAEALSALKMYMTHGDYDYRSDTWLFQRVRSQVETVGKPLGSRQVWEIFCKYRDQAGLSKHFTPHTLRATLITEAFEKQVPAKDIQATVGHASVTTTLGYNRAAFKPRQSASLAVNF